MYDFQVPKPSQKPLPTMYDLPSEDPEELGLPDEFHPTQAQLLRETFRSPSVPGENFFIGTDINLYYDSRHTQWYERPDWFLVLGVARIGNSGRDALELCDLAGECGSVFGGGTAIGGDRG